MPYTINKTDGTTVTTITDGTLDNTTSLTLFGKVKCKVSGYIRKGDMLATHNLLPGVAKKISDPNPGTVIGKALEDYDSTEIGTINIVVGRC